MLSGGERNRYALARMLMQPSNFLLLDEPTNHLDMRAKDVLLDALQEFTGTLVFVSHDRYFIDKLATRVFEVEDGRVHVFPGNYEDYLWRKSGGPATPGERRCPRKMPPVSNERDAPSRVEGVRKARQPHQAAPDAGPARGHRGASEQGRDGDCRSGDRAWESSSAWTKPCGSTTC